METTFRSGDALLVFDAERTILSWNRAAEDLTGIPAAEAVGRPCWDVLGGVDERGSLVCHPGCSGARLASEGWPVRSHRLLIRTAAGTRRSVGMSTIAFRDAGSPLYLHLLWNGWEVEDDHAPADSADSRTPLTRRQLQVLGLLDQGFSAKRIAGQLGIAESTVRNHIRAILLQFGCHSQLEALAAARKSRLLSDRADPGLPRQSPIV